LAMDPSPSVLHFPGKNNHWNRNKSWRWISNKLGELGEAESN